MDPLAGRYAEIHDPKVITELYRLCHEIEKLEKTLRGWGRLAGVKAVIARRATGFKRMAVIAYRKNERVGSGTCMQTAELANSKLR